MKRINRMFATSSALLFVALLAGQSVVAQIASPVVGVAYEAREVHMTTDDGYPVYQTNEGIYIADDPTTTTVDRVQVFPVYDSNNQITGFTRTQQ